MKFTLTTLPCLLRPAEYNFVRYISLDKIYVVLYIIFELKNLCCKFISFICKNKFNFFISLYLIPDPAANPYFYKHRCDFFVQFFLFKLFLVRKNRFLLIVSLISIYNI